MGSNNWGRGLTGTQGAIWQRGDATCYFILLFLLQEFLGFFSSEHSYPDNPYS